MENRHPKPVENYMTANLILIFVNLLWVFVAIWSYWGLGPVLILAALLNYLITRVEVSRRNRDGEFDSI